ncbi:MFS transporter permease, partial [Corynebacterium sanguinis]|nr:MFS transporter permease [Corynebacterium sanguinis]
MAQGYLLPGCFNPGRDESVNNISRSLLVALALLSAVGPFGIDMYLPGLPTLQEDLGTTPAMAQLTITGF